MAIKPASERPFVMPLAFAVLFGAAAGAVAGLMTGVYILPPLIPAEDALARRFSVEPRSVSVAPETAGNAVAASVVRLVSRDAIRELLGAEGGAFIPESAVIGRAVALTSDGWLVTTLDLAPELRAALAITSAGVVLPLDRTVRDPGSGALFLKVDASNVPVIPFGDSRTTRAGDAVMVVPARGEVVLGNLRTRRAEPPDLTAAVSSSELIPARLLLPESVSRSQDRGSPVIDRTGRLMGIVESASDRVIPAASFRMVLTGLFRTGAVHRPYLGVRALDRSALVGGEAPARGGALLLDLPGKPAVIRSSPAFAAGLRAGDVILAVEGTSLEPNSSLAEALVDFEPGNRITLLVLRGDETLSLSVTLGDTAERE